MEKRSKTRSDEDLYLLAKARGPGKRNQQSADCTCDVSGWSELANG